MRTSLIVLAGYVAVMTIGVVVGQTVFRRRRRAYDRYCLDRGFQLEPRRPREETRHVTTCPLFAEGRARYWGFTIVGVTNGSPFIAFEYEWITGPARFWTDHTIAGILWTLRRDHMLPFFDPVFERAVAEIQRYNRTRSVTVTANVQTGYNTDRVTRQALDRLGSVAVPFGYRIVPAGEIESRQESFGGVGGAITVATFVDLTNRLRAEGMDLEAAIRQAGEVRFLPIVLTSLTAIGGLVSSTLLARIVTPVMYQLLAPQIEVV